VRQQFGQSRDVAAVVLGRSRMQRDHVAAGLDRLEPGLDLGASGLEVLDAAYRIRRGYSGAIVQIGKSLLQAKHYLSHRLFVRWVEDEVGLPARTAQAHMQAARWLQAKSATVALCDTLRGTAQIHKVPLFVIAIGTNRVSDSLLFINEY
jgi:hypothetical protein